MDLEPVSLGLFYLFFGRKKNRFFGVLLFEGSGQLGIKESQDSWALNCIYKVDLSLVIKFLHICVDSTHNGGF